MTKRLPTFFEINDFFLAILLTPREKEKTLNKLGGKALGILHGFYSDGARVGISWQR